MYKIISGLSIIIRVFYLPNPFECFGTQAFIINAIAEPFIHALAFGLTGTIYTRGSAPAVGSAIYLLFYIVIVSVLAFLGKFSFAWWNMLATAMIFMTLKYITDKLFS